MSRATDLLLDMTGAYRCTRLNSMRIDKSSAYSEAKTQKGGPDIDRAAIEGCPLLPSQTESYSRAFHCDPLPCGVVDMKVRPAE